MGRALVPLAAWLAEAFCRKDYALHDREKAQRCKNYCQRRE